MNGSCELILASFQPLLKIEIHDPALLAGNWIQLCANFKITSRCYFKLYIYDTDNEVANRMHHFTNSAGTDLDPQVVHGIITFLDNHNELVRLFRTTRDKCRAENVKAFKIRLYNADGLRGYELPASHTLGGIVFDSGPTTLSDYGVIIKYKDGPLQRINKLHQSYMSLQFPLIFIYGQPGYHTKLKVRSADPANESA